MFTDFPYPLGWLFEIELKLIDELCFVLHCRLLLGICYAADYAVISNSRTFYDDPIVLDRTDGHQ